LLAGAEKENVVSRKTGFTLVELLVVIAVVSLLMGVLMPALNLVRSKAHGIVCQARVRDLLRAYILYAGDNDGGLVSGDTSDKVEQGVPSTYCWVKPPQYEDGTILPDTQRPTLAEELRGITRGYLYPYVKVAKVYHCDGARENESLGGYRSYSIPGLMNGEYARPAFKVGRPDLVATKITQIKRPETKLVFLEDTDTRGWNMGSWVMDPSGRAWVDPFAIWHGDSSSVGFADGHTELHLWVSMSTKILCEEQAWGLNPDDYDGDRRDIEFMHKAFLPRL
jgi:prepilin-type N-terminal cleavage/methylation domain-containing protein/prepilin-type processing-associated H-X9-DG protein